jgi:hypothetical protein
MQPKGHKADTLPAPHGTVDPPGASVPAYVTNPDGTVTPPLRWVKNPDGTITPSIGWAVSTTRTPPRGAHGRRPRRPWIGYAIRAYLEAHPQERDRLAQKYGWID